MKNIKLVLAFAAVLFLIQLPVFAQDTWNGKAGGGAAGEKTGNKEKDSSTNEPVELRELKHMISFLNLFNGLHLTEEQLERLIEINSEYKKLFDDNEEKFAKALEQEKKVLSELEAVIRTGSQIPEKLKKKVYAVEDRSRKLRRAVDEATVKYSGLVEEIFTDEQLEVVKDFQPCTIPPKNLRDPVRVGQASDNEHIISLFRRIRQMPRHMFEANIEKIVDRHMQKLGGRKRLSEEEAAQERQRMKEFLWKVHILDEVEFEMCKEELAGEYKWKDRAKELQKELGEVQKVRHPKAHKGKAAKYFLNPAILPVLEERLAGLRGASDGLKGRKASRAKRREK